MNQDPNRCRISGAGLGAGLTLCLCIVCLLAPGRSLAVESVRVGLPQSPPIVFTDEQGRPAGLAIDVLAEVARDHDWETDFVQGTWRERPHRRDDPAPERARRLDFTASPLISNWGLVIARPGAEALSLLDLSGTRIAAARRAVHTQALTALLGQFGIEARFVPVDDYPAVVAALREGRAVPV